MTRRLYQTPHLAQGAPTSPALANLAAFNLDTRLAGLARCYDVNYTRYADDLVFSGGEDVARKTDSLRSIIEAITLDEGYRLNARKTRVMRRGACLRVTGLVINTHVNVPRQAFDELKAILHNCRKSAPAHENRANHPNFQAHLDGRVSWVEHVNPLRGRRLRAMFDKIVWQTLG